MDQAKGGHMSGSAAHLRHPPPGLHRRLLSFTHQLCGTTGLTRARRHLVDKMSAVSPLLDVT